jgi:UDP-N-acetylglucosamine 1-carboxyvinyltransferase
MTFFKLWTNSSASQYFCGASIDGIPQLSGAPVEATDIRVGAGLVLTALVSEQETRIEGAFHIDRRYPNFVKDLVKLGARFKGVQNS